ncbi:hypothetical protein GWI33_022462 [Rhynchophorus ferrugineus]|uniref:C-type lectin domain-containing protein n=1 Tax=Rhynchophorus ferrugineus TaxID=354439 RepID=A0A834IUP2_RHYFE|nr:hypothetical protein GWI33_022462 [Rhynchophorus ferrugineus]
MFKITVAWNDSVKLVVSKESTTFLDAYLRCHQYGYDAFEILSEEDERQVEYALNSHSTITSGWQNGYWIFALNLGKSSNYYWLESGKPLIYSIFSPGQPDNADPHNCLLISKTTNGSFEWHDVRCDQKLRFICKYLKNK